MRRLRYSVRVAAARNEAVRGYRRKMSRYIRRRVAMRESFMRARRAALGVVATRAVIDDKRASRGAQQRGAYAQPQCHAVRRCTFYSYRHAIRWRECAWRELFASYARFAAFACLDAFEFSLRYYRRAAEMLIPLD